MAEVLEDGWNPGTPASDSLVRAFVTGFGDLISGVGRAVGARVLEDDDVIAVDSGTDFFLANGAVLRHPVRDADLPEAIDRLRGFFAGGPGVAWMLLSAWPIPPIERMNLIGHPPLMLRPAGGEAPPLPPGLALREARDGAGMADFAQALAGYPAPATEVFANARILDDPARRFWVGYVDDRPVACAGVHVTDVCNEVEYVAAHPEVRGRGIGAAVTWAATLADPTKPALLIASDPGQPVYEKMGYLRLMRMTMWGASPGS
jgi:GNAT superfamily N-acetyltransferase